ncbi:MAG: endonuclease/exonuclease/phosphatase family protein [Prevotellaceae bacterium]|nr:endonuclease/exonuclease/phosphatase family protein [Prevotellaceae bacterium]
MLVPNFFLLICFFRPLGSSKYIAGPDRLKILTFNIQGFKIPYQKNTTQKEIADFVNSTNADIVCLQEFYVNDKITEELFAGMLSKYRYHSVFYSVRRATRSFGIITFSKYPIKRTLEIPFENTANAAMYSDIDVAGKTLRVYNLHFQSIKLNLTRLFSRKQDFSNEIEEVSQRLKTAFIKRAGQVDIVAKHINVSPYPVVICGDFNDTPASYTYNKIKGNRLDTFCEAGRGCPSTYRLSFVPSFRIDYILHDRIIHSMSHSIHDTVVCSDHYPVSSIIDISETGKKQPDF